MAKKLKRVAGAVICAVADTPELAGAAQSPYGAPAVAAMLYQAAKKGYTDKPVGLGWSIRDAKVAGFKEVVATGQYLVEVPDAPAPVATPAAAPVTA